MKRRLIGFGSALLLILGMFLAFNPGVANAFSQCHAYAGDGNAWFDGFGQANTDTHIPYGVSAQLTYESPGDLCDSDNTSANYDAVWSMDANYSALGGWVQSGWGWDPTMSCPEHFAQAEVGTSYTPQTVFYGNGTGHCVTAGQVHQVWTQYKASITAYSMNIDTTILLTSNFDPATAWGWGTNIRAQFFGELSYKTSNMPGTASTPSDFANMLYQTTAANSTGFASTCALTLLASSDNPSFWTFSAPACNHIKIWSSVIQ